MGFGMGLVVDSQQLFQGAPAVEAVVLEPEAVGCWGRSARLDGEFTGSPAVPLLVRPTRYETADRSHGCLSATGPTGVRVRGGVG